MGDTKDSKKIQADRAAKKAKDKQQARRAQPDTTSGKAVSGGDTSSSDRKKGS